MSWPTHGGDPRGEKIVATNDLEHTARFLDEPGIFQAGKKSPRTGKRRPSKLRELRRSVDASTLNVQKLPGQVSTKENLQHELTELGEEVADMIDAMKKQVLNLHALSDKHSNGAFSRRRFESAAMELT